MGGLIAATLFAATVSGSQILQTSLEEIAEKFAGNSPKICQTNFKDLPQVRSAEPQNLGINGSRYPPMFRNTF